MQVLKKINRKATIDGAISERCRRSFFYFVKTMWDTVISEPFINNWHIEYICNELQRIGERVKERKQKEFDYYIINVPPGTSKSTIISEMYPLWCWIIDPTQRFICGSFSSTVSEDIAEKSRKVFLSEKYQTLFPEVGILKDAKTHYANSHNGERYTTSTGSGITGIHAHQLIIDDPLSPSQASSEVERITANKWISETLSTRKVNKEVSVVILVMQRLHEEDPTGHLLSKTKLKIKHICFPSEKSEIIKPAECAKYYKNGLMDVNRMPLSVLEQAREDLGSYGYAGQYGQTPANLAGGIIKKNWFEIVDGSWQDKIVNFVMDTAYTSKSDNDPSGFMAYYKEGNDMVITNWESLRLEFPDLTRHTISFAKNNGYTSGSSVRVEPKASGLSLVQQLRTETRLNISEDDNPVKDKVTRATSITPVLEAKRVKLLRGAWNEVFLHEVCTFPKAPHDEAVDCLVMAVNRELINNNKIFGYAVR